MTAGRPDAKAITERVARTIERYAMLPAGVQAGVAVSGGRDSLCLLHLLLELQPFHQYRLTVIHLNHQLRGAESNADAEFVVNLAASLRLDVVERSVDVRGQALAAGDNLEQAARRARQRLFLDLIRQGRVERIATGHTMSDQAETVLYRMIRGSGTAGLAAIRPVNSEGLVRPLIEISRPDVETWLAAHGIRHWREDSSNADVRLIRNRIRHHILPELARSANPTIVPTLARVASMALDEEDYWAGVIAPLAEEMLIQRPPAVFLKAASLRSLHRALARRLVRRALALAKGDLRGIDLSHIEEVLALSESRAGAGRFQVPGLDILRSFDWIRVVPPGTGRRPEYQMAAPIPGGLELPGGRGRLEFRLEPGPGSGCPETPIEEESSSLQGFPNCGKSRYNDGESALDWARVSGSGIEVRNWKPGDAYRPCGAASETKLKTLFHEARIPLWVRRGWPVATSGDRVVWAARFGPAADCAASARTRTVLWVREIGFLTEF